MHIGWVWYFMVWYAHSWLNIYPYTPKTDLHNAGLHSRLEEICGSLTFNPRSWLNSFKIMWRSSIFLRVFRMAWTEQLCVLEEEEPGLGSCFCQATPTSLNLFKKRRCSGSDCNTEDTYTHRDATLFEQNFLEIIHIEWNNVKGQQHRHELFSGERSFQT